MRWGEYKIGYLSKDLVGKYKIGNLCKNEVG